MCSNLLWQQQKVIHCGWHCRGCQYWTQLIISSEVLLRSSYILVQTSCLRVVYSKERMRNGAWESIFTCDSGSTDWKPRCALESFRVMSNRDDPDSARQPSVVEHGVERQDFGHQLYCFDLFFSKLKVKYQFLLSHNKVINANIVDELV